MWFGLPEYYRQIPPYVPNFFKTLFRRKLVIWFLISEILRDYWLSGPYGRSWQYLWSQAGVPKWAVVIMIAIFFVGIWGLLLGILIRKFGCLPSQKCVSNTQSQGIPRFTLGFFPSLPLVSVVLDGVRCGGVPPAWLSIFHGVGALVLTSVSARGSGLVSLMLSRVSAWAWSCCRPSLDCTFV